MEQQTANDIVISKPQSEILSTRKDANLMMTGQGAGKTYTIPLLAENFISLCPEIIGMICANTYGQLSEATLKETKKVWKELFNWKEYDVKGNKDGVYCTNRYPPKHWLVIHEKFDTPHHKIFFKNGAVVFTASLDNYKALDGRTIGWCILDETKDTKEEAVKDVILGRLRQKGLFLYPKGYKEGFQFTKEKYTNEVENQPINPLFIFTTPYKELWLIVFFGLKLLKKEIKKSIFNKLTYFRKETGNKLIIMASTYSNKELPSNYIKNMLENLKHDQEKIELNIYGYPFGNTGKEYVKTYKETIHVDDGVCYNPDYAIHKTLDFNTSPYMTGVVTQLIPMTGDWNGFKNWIDVNVFDLYTLKSPKNSAGHLSIEFSADYTHLLGHGLYVYGDASGMNNIAIKGVKNLFDDYIVNLDESIFYEIRVPNSNPRYKNMGKGTLGRRNFVNLLFAGSKPVRIRIHSKCSELIDDLAFCEEDVNGKLKKKKDKNGVEQRGHCLDALQYLLCHKDTFLYLAKIK